MLPGAVVAGPVVTGATGLHLCQICTAEPTEEQSIPYVSVVIDGEDGGTAPLESTPEGTRRVEGDESTAVVEMGAELPKYQSRPGKPP